VGREAARARAEALLDTALRAIDTLGDRAEPLRELARFAVRRGE
jgi:geranylgeranyl pyrophosphate synthase